MAGKFVPPAYSPAQVDAAGAALVISDSLDEQNAEIINNWRAAHSYPLNTFQKGLRDRAAQVYENALISQRLKRRSSIAFKLRDKDWIKLSTMQDIGGCRAVVKSSANVSAVVKNYHDSEIRHIIDKENDYIKQPKPSGYRGYHLIYNYFSDKATPSVYNGLKIEVQLRSLSQHYWATAVEIAGTFTEQALKSSHGSRDWLRFFALMGSDMARRERTTLVPGTPTTRKDLRDEIRHYADILNVRNHFQTWHSALTIPDMEQMANAHYFLLRLDPIETRLTVRGFQSKELESATKEYLLAEENRGSADVVLVSVSSMRQLRRAYPNYYLDSVQFLKSVDRAIF